MSELTPTQAEARLADAFSLWRLQRGTVSTVVDAATDCLVAGVDSPHLRELAGASPGESQFVLEPLAERALEELGMQEIVSSNVHQAALIAMIRRLTDGQIRPQQLVQWAHRYIGHDGDARCQVFVDLDDMYDTADYADYADYKADKLDRWIAEEAEAYVSGLPPIGRTKIWREPAPATAVIRGPRWWRRRRK